MKRGCLLSLLLFAAASGGYYFLLSPRATPPADIVGALCGAVAAFLSFGLLRNAFLYAGDSSRLGRAMMGDTPVDGTLVAAAGKIEPAGAPLQTPFGKRDVVLFSYEIFNELQRADDTNAKSLSFSGFCMTPCVVRSSPRELLLLGFPMLEGFPREVFDDNEHRENARQYIAKTSFEEIGGLQITKIFSQVKDLLTDADGTIQKNWKLSKQETIGNESMKEEYVAAGESVCAFGLYSASKRGLIPDVGGKGSVNRLVRGNPKDVRAKLRWKAVRYFIGGIVLFVFLNGIIWFVIQARENSREIKFTKSDVLFDAARQGDLARLEKLFEYRLDANLRNSDKKTALMVAESAAVVDFLVEKGADVNAIAEEGSTALMNAASSGKTDVVQSLIRHGADLNVRHPQWHSTALILADDAGHEEAAEILRRAGAADDVVSEKNGTPLPADGGEPFAVCKRYIAAIHAKDIPILSQIYYYATPGFYDDVDFKIWQETRPTEPELVSGYMNDGNATLTLYGMTGAGYGAKWVYQLKKDHGVWRIVRAASTQNRHSGTNTN